MSEAAPPPRSRPQPYGDLVELNDRREVLDGVGRELLEQIAEDYLELLGTSSAVYERNGDYALGIFSSGWCRLMDAASRRLCGTESDAEALASGKWHCHESCWQVSRTAMETRGEADLPCRGGLRLYAVPITAGGEVVGAINFGYGDPPRDPVRLRELAADYGVTEAELEEAARAYPSRTPEAVETAKRRLRSSAALIGEILARRRAEAELRRANARLEILADTTARLMASEDPLHLVGALLERLAVHLGLEVYFHYLLEETADGPRLRLASYGGVEPEVARGCEWLDVGEAVCGTVAREGERKVVEEVASSSEPVTGLIRSLGITAYVCHPLSVRGRAIGTLSFGTRTRPHFQPDELSLLQAVADQVAMALDRARSREAERRARAAAEEASRAKSRFLAVMSHELRTPLNAIIGYQDLLAGEIAGPLTARQGEHIDRIRESAWHLLELINQVLTLSKIEAGREEAVVDAVDAVEVARGAVSLVEPQARKKGLPLHAVFPEGAVEVETDPGKLRQILLNLLANAVKFTEEGEVELAVASDPARGSVLFRVRDTGPGIAPEHQEAVFEPFTQVDQSNTRVQGGTGLGLPISRRLARLLGGDLTLESAPGRGSAFTLRLPLRPAPAG